MVKKKSFMRLLKTFVEYLWYTSSLNYGDTVVNKKNKASDFVNFTIYLCKTNTEV